MKHVTWFYKGEVYRSAVERRCPLCRAFAVIELPPAVLAEQPDDTTHVCHPLIGGCNHGFALEAPEVYRTKQEPDR